MSNGLGVVYNSTDTATDFHLDNSFVRLLLGPVGSGKSVANCIEIFRRASEQAPGNDGIRRSKWAIIRNTYPELKATTIKTWCDWFPQEIFGPVKWDTPISHRIKMGDIDLEVIFLALEGEKDIKKLMSFELTGIYFNEMQFISHHVFINALSRVDRYPPKKFGAPITWTGVICDTNPPDTDHWIYRLFELERPDNYSIFKYAPALLDIDNPDEYEKKARSLDGQYYVENPDADYVRCQPNAEYWYKLITSYVSDEIKVLLQGQYGVIRVNKPVYPSYNDNLHSGLNLKLEPGYQIYLGWDFGLTPACVVTQYVEGQLRVIKEFVSDNCTLEDLIKLSVKPWLNINAEGYAIQSDCDPADNALLNHKVTLDRFGIETDYGLTNLLQPRLDAVKTMLSELVFGKPRIIVSPEGCPVLRSGFVKDYYYKRVKVYGEEVYKEEPYKSHPVSDIHDCLQYVCLRVLSDTSKPISKSKISFVDNMSYF